MRRRWLAIAVILTVASGCDNVTWGGASVSLRTPEALAADVSEPAREPEPEEVEEEPETAPERDVGSTLLAGTRSGPRATLVAVGSIRRGAVVPLTATGSTPRASRELARGAELVLFSEGVRVGRMTVDSVGIDPRACFRRPSVSGVVELLPSATDASRFLALPARDADALPFGRPVALQHDYDQRVASLAMAREAIPSVGAIWPPSVLEAREDIQVFRLPDRPGPSVAATFLYGDTLAVARPLPRAYSLFVLGGQRATGIATEHVWYRPADEEGKGVPRYFGHLDWSGDGRHEVLLEVLGAEHRWFAALAQRDSTWVRAFEDSCVDAAAVS